MVIGRDEANANLPRCFHWWSQGAEDTKAVADTDATAVEDDVDRCLHFLSHSEATR